MQSPRPPPGFRTGDLVEVTSDEDGFRGAHFAARVGRSLPKLRRYTVVYESLVSGDGSPLRETVSAHHVRPRPPPPPPAGCLRLAEHDVVDALFNEAWWTGVAVGPPAAAAAGGCGGKVAVCFADTREVMEFEAGEVRPHLEWVDCKWLSPERLEIPKTLYDKGSQVEVAQLQENSVVAWFPAVVVKIIWKSSFLVEYMTVKNGAGTKLSKEIVDLQYIRPCPPRASAINFCMHDEVEAFCGDGWWPGVITKTHPGSVYTFKSMHLDKEVQFSQKFLRLNHNWVDGQWIPVSQNKAKMKFTKGTKVEVSSDDEGFRGAWYEGTILKSVGNKFLVEYETLRTDDESMPLMETVELQHIRPSPPEAHVIGGFKFLDEVDAFHNEGWWVGVISKVMSGSRYVVYFKPWKEEMEFGPEQLRLHYDWVDGRWMRASPALEL